MSPNLKKTLFGIWYLTLIIVVVDALLEWGYPRSTYYPRPWQPITQQLSLFLILATGIPIMLYLWKRTPSRKLLITLLATTLILVTVLTHTPWSQLRGEPEHNGTSMTSDRKASTLSMPAQTTTAMVEEPHASKTIPTSPQPPRP
jgi:hypothetical protein